MNHLGKVVFANGDSAIFENLAKSLASLFVMARWSSSYLLTAILLQHFTYSLVRKLHTFCMLYFTFTENKYKGTNVKLITLFNKNVTIASKYLNYLSQKIKLDEVKYNQIAKERTKPQ